METFLLDLRFGFRNLLKTRGLTAVAIVTLALGIGANTAIFSVIDAVLLRPLPFQHPGELVRLYETEAAPGNYPFTGPDFFDWKTQNKSFQDMTLFSWPQDMNLSDTGRAERVIGVSTEWNFFQLLGARPLLGRTWAQGEDALGNNIAILSYGLWQTHFGGDANIVGKNIELSAKAFTVIGVMPPSFSYPDSAQLWTPQPMDNKTLGPRGSHSWRAVGRLKPGVTLKQAQTEMSLIASRLEKQYPDSNYKVGASLVALHEDLVGSARDSLIMMLWAVALVLLIACANVANLLLSRSLARQREMAIRSALGAARTRLVRQLLTESVLLAATGGAVGLAVAWAGVRILANSKQLGIPRMNPVELNLPVLAFTFAIAVISGIVFGIIPALQTSRPDLHDELKGGAGASVTHSRTRHFTSNVLVVGEMGLSLLLLIAAGLLLKDFAVLRNTKVGVRSEGVWTGVVRLPNTIYAEQDAKQRDFGAALLARVRQIPGVDAAALSTRLPVEGGSNGYISVRGRPYRSMDGPLVEMHAATPDYFRVLGIPLIAGRNLNEVDAQQAFKVDETLTQAFQKYNQDIPSEILEPLVTPVVINRAMVKAFWPDQDPIGQMYSGGEHGPWRQVVGVVGDVKQWGLVHEPVPENYLPFDGSTGLYVVLHTSLAPGSLTDAVRRAVTAVDSNVPLFRVRTMDQVIADQAQGQRFVTTLVGIFAGLALLLAAVGIYGVLSYLVTQRTREIGIRMSLGADRADVLRLVLGHGARLAIAGCVVGVVGAFAATRVLRSVLLLAKGQDPRIFLVAVAALVGVALFACYVPARRATRVDPVIALRYE